MNRIILSTLLLLGILQAEELTIEQEAKLRNYNHSISAKLRHKRAMQYIAKLKKDDAKLKAKELVTEEVNGIKLMHHNRKLFYFVTTQNYKIKIDAMDGEIIEKGRIE